MVKTEQGFGSCRVIERWHGLNPFGKIIDHHDNLLMIINRWWSTLHKFDGPFTERNNSDDRMEGSQ